MTKEQETLLNLAQAKMNTATINYKEVFELAESKGYKRIFEWDNPFEHTYNKEDDYFAIDESVIKSNPEQAYSELCLIQKWLRDTHNYNIGLIYFDNKIGKWWDYRVHYTGKYGSAKTYESALLKALNEALQLI